MVFDALHSQNNDEISMQAQLKDLIVAQGSFEAT